MHKQRLGILIAACVGISTSFMPWLSIAGTGTLSPFQSNDWVYFILFSIPIILCLIGNPLQPLNKWQFYGAIIPSAIAVLSGSYNINYAISSNSSLKDIDRRYGNAYPSDTFTLEYGIFFMVLTGIALIIIAIKTKEKYIQYDRPQELNLLVSKRCHYCAETINRDAKKCKFCGEFLDSDFRKDKEI